MKRGRKSKLLFGLNHPHIGEEATKATNTGAYTVESLEGGIYYFCEGNYITIASVSGHVRMNLDTAELVAEEINGIVKDFRQDKKEGRTPMNTRSISKMLEIDA